MASRSISARIAMGYGSTRGRRRACSRIPSRTSWPACSAPCCEASPARRHPTRDPGSPHTVPRRPPDHAPAGSRAQPHRRRVRADHRAARATPTFAELGVFSALWSEHCSYKHSRPVLKTFPTTGAQVVQGPGENAGVLRLPGGWAVAFKIESHNHPSAVEPYQGAATGVGGILRDVFTMGARPVAVLQ